MLKSSYTAIIITMIFFTPLLWSQNVTVCLEDQLYIPYLDKNERKETDGSLVNLLSWSAKQAGLDVTLKRQVWGRCLSDIANGKVDAAMAVNYTPERAKVMAFPQGADLDRPLAYLWRFHYPFFIKKGDAFSFEQYRQQSKYGISSPSHYVSYDMLKRQGLLSPYNYELDSGLQMVAIGRLDAYVVESEIGKSAIGRLGLTEQVIQSKDVLFETYSHIAFSRPFYLKHKQQVDKLWQSLALGRAQLFNFPE